MTSHRWVPRLLLGLGAVALSAAIVSISVGTGGPKVIRLTGGDAVQELLGGIQEDGADLGPPEAPIRISVFTDLQCSTCDDYEIQTVDPLIEEYARTGKAQFEFRNYSLGQAETTKAAYAAVAAGQQDREWEFVDMFFRNQDAAPAHTVSSDFLDDIVNSITDLDRSTWLQGHGVARGQGSRRCRRDACGRLRAAGHRPLDRGRGAGRHEGPPGLAERARGRARGCRG